MEPEEYEDAFTTSERMFTSEDARETGIVIEVNHD